jgi:uncharacterized protein (TIGR02246 family)
MRRRIAPLVAGLAFATLACAPADTAPAAQAVDLAADEQAVRDVSMRWLELAKARDAAGIAALFTEDGTLLRPAMAPIVGRAAIEAHLASEQAANPTAVPGWTTDRVEVGAAGDIAVEHGTWSETSLGADGAGQDDGKYLAFFRKVGGSWYVVTDVSISTKAEATGGS